MWNVAKCDIQLQIVMKAEMIVFLCNLISHMKTMSFILCQKGLIFLAHCFFGGLYLSVSLSKGKLKDIGHAAVANSLSLWFATNSQVVFFRNCQVFCFYFSVIGFTVVSVMSN